MLSWMRTVLAMLSRPKPLDLGFRSALAPALIKHARSQLGCGEEGGNNRGPDIDRYRGDLGGTGSWCAAFVYWCIERACEDVEWDPPFPRTHSAKRLWRSVAQYGGAFVKRPQPGDVVCWDRGVAGSWQGHVGIVDKVEGNVFWAIEGNRGAAPSRVRRFKHEVGEGRLLGCARLP